MHACPKFITAEPGSCPSVHEGSTSANQCFLLSVEGSASANQCFSLSQYCSQSVFPSLRDGSTLANQCFALSVMAIPQPISVFLCLQWWYHSQSVGFSLCPWHHLISNHLMISDGYTWAETEHFRRRWSFSLGFSEALIKWNGSVPCALTVFFSYSAFGKHTVNMSLSVLVVLICDKDGYKWNSLSIKCLHTTVSTPLLCLKRDDIFFFFVQLLRVTCQ